MGTGAIDSGILRGDTKRITIRSRTTQQWEDSGVQTQTMTRLTNQGTLLISRDMALASDRNSTSRLPQGIHNDGTDEGVPDTELPERVETGDQTGSGGGRLPKQT